ncbi:MAG: AmmeMemoRadiSam system protein B [Desulfobulbaceae bacterium]|jgi:MEMO1 family protein|nr:AmmeMemoRadiSam system protein B [Desulfobulbaceae bacterium]
MKMRQPVVADRFYPGSPEALALEINELMPTGVGTGKQRALAVVAPHAGYVYSGALAALTFASVVIPETVIIIGPNHRGQGAPVALSAATWKMPLGNVPVDKKVCDLLVSHSQQIKIDEQAHKYEHSLEVQVPFLQILQKNLSIVALVISHISYQLCEEVANALAKAISTSNRDILIVASSDMSHYESRTNTEKKDRLALQCIEQFNPFDLYHTIIDKRISMCGFIPVVIAMLAAKIQGGKNYRLVGYTDSGYVSGDAGQVVGYAGIILH